MVKKRSASRGTDELSMFDPRVIDPDEEMVQYRSLDEEELDHTVQVLESLRRWHQTERRMSEESRRYMELGETDMRALRYAIAVGRHGRAVTPRMLAEHLGISTASVTKMLDRLAAADHIRRTPHPVDRRSTVVEVAEETRRAARESIGRSHAERFRVAAELSSEERDVVIRFLSALADTGVEHGAPSEPGSSSTD